MSILKWKLAHLHFLLCMCSYTVNNDDSRTEMIILMCFWDPCHLGGNQSRPLTQSKPALRQQAGDSTALWVFWFLISRKNQTPSPR